MLFRSGNWTPADQPGAGVGSNWQGDIAEVIVFQSELSASDRQSVEDYLSSKYQLPVRGTVQSGGVSAEQGVLVEAGILDDGSDAPGVASTMGGLRSSDVDAGATASWSGNAQGVFGRFSIDAGTGKWTYELDNGDLDTQLLAPGQTATESFTAIATDQFGATGSYDVTVEIQGARDIVIFGTAAADVLLGSNADEVLLGDIGDDVIDGGAGNDLIAGESGHNTLTGGAGSDRFALGGEDDTITDFTTGLQGDVLDIKDLLSGYSPASSILSDFVQLSHSGGNTIVSVDRDGAARMERAPGRDRFGLRRIAAEARRRHAEPRIADRRVGRGERAGVGVGGFPEHGAGGSFLHDGTRVHDREAVADLDEHREVVGDEEHREDEAVLQVLQQPEHLRLHHHVERGRRLVGDDDLRVAGERHRDHHALLLATGELVRVVVGASRREAHLLEELADPARRARLVGRGVHEHRLGDLVADRAHGVQRVERALEDDRRARPAHRAQTARLHREDVLAVEQDLPRDLGPRRQEPHRGVHDRGLPAARLPRHPEHLAARDVEGRATHGGDRTGARAVGDVQVADGEDAHRSRSLGLKTSSSANPHIVNARTTRTIARPGGTSHHH